MRDPVPHRSEPPGDEAKSFWKPFGKTSPLRDDPDCRAKLPGFPDSQGMPAMLPREDVHGRARAAPSTTSPGRASSACPLTPHPAMKSLLRLESLHSDDFRSCVCCREHSESRGRRQRFLRPGRPRTRERPLGAVNRACQNAQISLAPNGTPLGLRQVGEPKNQSAPSCDPQSPTSSVCSRPGALWRSGTPMRHDRRQKPRRMRTFGIGRFGLRHRSRICISHQAPIERQDAGRLRRQ
jgi:hypothetical protein